MPSINRRLLAQGRRCLSRQFHTGQSLLAKPPSTPRFQKPASLAKEGLEKGNTGAPTATTTKLTVLGIPQTSAPPRTFDTSSKEYKQAERKWISVIVALPILFVTSYFLFERLALGKVPPPLPGTAPNRAPETANPNSNSEGSA
ncbi:hypothetical protein QBC38DRAFT_443848 [Podospora fimiseda]|uniref:Uncharacterized protein n=1 Tax=Podospora fimiseda TaxID=252190 RepID=A0AAN7H4J0_9PEZI|nr:hypothetical protein QBC38DRAFT_443848 [Podospora fimiseda]